MILYYASNSSRSFRTNKLENISEFILNPNQSFSIILGTYVYSEYWTSFWLRNLFQFVTGKTNTFGYFITNWETYAIWIPRNLILNKRRNSYIWIKLQVGRPPKVHVSATNNQFESFNSDNKKQEKEITNWREKTKKITFSIYTHQVLPRSSYYSEEEKLGYIFCGSFPRLKNHYNYRRSWCWNAILYPY